MTPTALPTEPIGSIPRPPALVQAIRDCDAGRLDPADLDALYDEAQHAYVGVIDVLEPRVETPQEVCQRVLEAARHIPPDQLGTTDDCGYCPFCDDTSTSRDTAFAKIRARVEGTALASAVLGL